MSSNALPIRESLPASMRFALSASDAVPSTATLRRFDSQNGSSFTGETNNEIRIPVQAGMAFLDTNKHYFNADLTGVIANNVGRFVQLDTDAYAIFQQIRIESQGVELERDDRASAMHIYRKQYNSTYEEANTQAIEAGAGASALACPSRGQTFIVNATTTFNYSLKLDCGFLGGHYEKALPAGLAPFTIVARLNTKTNALIAATNAGVAADITTFTTANPRIYIPSYTIDDPNVMAQYRAMVGQRGVSWSGDIYKVYIGAYAAAASTQIQQINDRSLSLKGLFTQIQDTNDATAGGLLTSVATSSIEDVTKVEYKIAGVSYPQGGIDVSNSANMASGALVTGETLAISRLHQEVGKVFAKSGYSHGYGRVGRANFNALRANAGAAVLTNALAGKGVVACDLRRFDDEKLAMVGLNTARDASPNTLELTFGAAPPRVGNLITYAICEAEWFMAPDGRISVQA